MNFIKRVCKDELEMYKSAHKTKFYIFLGLFIALCAISYVVVILILQDNLELQQAIFEYINETFSSINESVQVEGQNMSLALLENNIIATVTMIGLGGIPFLFLPIFSFVLNGVLIGIVGGFINVVGGFSVTYFMAGIIPHGIFEIPALIYSFTLGIYFCLSFTKYIVKHDSGVNMIKVLVDVIRGFVLVCVPLLIIAALVEGYITPLVLSMF